MGTRKKRPASRVFFFLPAFGRCCPSVSAPEHVLTQPGKNTDMFGPKRMYTKPWRSPIHVWPASIHPCSGLSIYLWGERSLNPLPDEASRTKREPEKKDPLRGSFFSYRPSAGAAPLGQWVPSKPWPQRSTLPGCRAILPFHSNTT